jgi:hypothetical protein
MIIVGGYSAAYEVLATSSEKQVRIRKEQDPHKFTVVLFNHVQHPYPIQPGNSLSQILGTPTLTCDLSYHLPPLHIHDIITTSYL